jgi:hypothetical protein
MRRRRSNGALRAAKWPQLHARRARGVSKRRCVARLGAAACVSAAHGDLRRRRPLRRATGPQRRRQHVRTSDRGVRDTWAARPDCPRARARCRRRSTPVPVLRTCFQNYKTPKSVN